jgi:hypothetical protein
VIWAQRATQASPKRPKSENNIPAPIQRSSKHQGWRQNRKIERNFPIRVHREMCTAASGVRRPKVLTYVRTHHRRLRGLTQGWGREGTIKYSDLLWHMLIGYGLWKARPENITREKQRLQLANYTLAIGSCVHRAVRLACSTSMLVRHVQGSTILYAGKRKQLDRRALKVSAASWTRLKPRVYWLEGGREQQEWDGVFCRCLFQQSKAVISL